MKRPRHVIPLLLALLVTCCALPSRAADDDKKPADKTKDLLDKLMDEAKKAAGKAQDKDGEGWGHSKELLKLSREEYTKKADFALKTLGAEIQALAESDAPVSGRDYFKTRIDALKQHLAYCQRDLDRLKEFDEDAFHAKQKNFDRTLGWLCEHLAATKEEAGL